MASDVSNYIPELVNCPDTVASSPDCHFMKFGDICLSKDMKSIFVCNTCQEVLRCVSTFWKHISESHYFEDCGFDNNDSFPKYEEDDNGIVTSLEDNDAVNEDLIAENSDIGILQHDYQSEHDSALLESDNYEENRLVLDFESNEMNEDEVGDNKNRDDPKDLFTIVYKPEHEAQIKLPTASTLSVDRIICDLDPVIYNIDPVESSTNKLISDTEEECLFKNEASAVSSSYITFVCAKCGMHCESSDQWKKHTKVHSNSLKTANKASNTIPIKSTSNFTNSFDCEVCGAKLTSQSNMRRHKRTHMTFHQFKCDLCDIIKTTKEAILIHIRRHHTGEKPYKCNYCDRTFVSISEKINHHKVHTGEKPFVCEKCGKCFKTSTLLRYHMDWHMDIKKFQCAICEKNFRTNAELKIHMGVHTNERPFKCIECLRPFKFKKHLQRHMNVHKGKTKLCTECGKGFGHPSSLASHMKSHSKSIE